MFVPFFTSRDTSASASSSSSTTKRRKRLYPRKGGGGGGRGGGGGGGGKSSGGSSSSGKGSSGSSSSSSSSSSKSSPSVSSGGKTISSKAYGTGGGKPAAIPSGQLFAGRMAGGGTRNQVFGSRLYGSGYPGIVGAGVAGRGFPFYFWPVVWGGALGAGTAAYLHDDEYGLPNNSSRPGGPMSAASFQSASNSSSSSNMINTFRIVSDNATITSLLTTLQSNCSSYLNASQSSTTPSAYEGYPVPEQVIQYYRASSVALTLDGYNNSAVYSTDDNAVDSPIPANTDQVLLTCLNETIGLAVPLSSGASNLNVSVVNMGFLGLMYVLWNVFSLF